MPSISHFLVERQCLCTRVIDWYDVHKFIFNKTCLFFYSNIPSSLHHGPPASPPLALSSTNVQTTGLAIFNQASMD